MTMETLTLSTLSTSTLTDVSLHICGGLPKDEFYYSSTALEEFEKNASSAQDDAPFQGKKLRRTHIINYVEFLAKFREYSPSLDVIQQPKWWKRGNPAVFNAEGVDRFRTHENKQKA